jgi:cytochrome P450
MTQTTPVSPPRWKDLAWLRAMRDAEPVWRNPETDTWHVFRYADVSAILADHRSFSSDFTKIYPEMSDMTDGNILTMDPPRHHRLRSLVSQAFTPRAIALLEPRIAAVTGELLDRVAGRTELELVADLAYPLPVIVIAEMLGVPGEDRERFREWAEALLSQDSMDPNDREAIEESMVELRKFREYLQDHVERRRAEPREDLLSSLVSAEVDGQRLDDREIVGFATILLLAGHITTTALLGNALQCLDEHPEAQAALRGDPGRLPTAIEEVLRHRSPFGQTTRLTAAEDVRVGDREIEAGRVVNVWLWSANRDERAFERPDDFLIDRQPNHHLAFGRGVHFCIGAPLARLEARVALAILLDRYASLRVEPGFAVEEWADPGINGVKELRLVAEPA